MRALQQTLPASRRILDDPYAAAFIQNPYLRMAAASRVGLWTTARFLDFWAMGGQEFIAIRARFADDLAKQMAGDGLKQLVMLGAGFDSMALRIKDALAGVTVFEVDHPSTQAVKRKVMDRLGTPSNVRFVPVDFEKDDLVESLKDAGFGQRRLSLTVWMGVSYYLTAQAMARSLTQIATLGAPHSRLTFDYILQDVIDGTTSNRDAKQGARRVAQVGEPWIFGLNPEELPAYLTTLGLKLIKDYPLDELRRIYSPRSLKPIDYARIVVCEIPER